MCTSCHLLICFIESMALAGAFLCFPALDFWQVWQTKMAPACSQSAACKSQDTAHATVITVQQSTLSTGGRLHELRPQQYHICVGHTGLLFIQRIASHSMSDHHLATAYPGSLHGTWYGRACKLA